MKNSFLKSHLGNTNQDDINFMLNKIGVENIDELMNQTIPNDIFLDQVKLTSPWNYKPK